MSFHTRFYILDMVRAHVRLRILNRNYTDRMGNHSDISFTSVAKPFCEEVYTLINALIFELSRCLSLVSDQLGLSRLMTKPTKWSVRAAKTQIRLGKWPYLQADLSLPWAQRSLSCFVMRRLILSLWLGWQNSRFQLRCKVCSYEEFLRSWHPKLPIF